MSLKIHPINFGNMSLDSSGLVLFREPGKQVTIPVLGFLITGGTEPVLVDTGRAASSSTRRSACRTKSPRK